MGDAVGAVEITVQLGFVVELRVLGLCGFKLYSIFLLGLNVLTLVDFPEGSTSDFLDELVLPSHNQIHVYFFVIFILGV